MDLKKVTEFHELMGLKTINFDYDHKLKWILDKAIIIGVENDPSRFTFSVSETYTKVFSYAINAMECYCPELTEKEKTTRVVAGLLHHDSFMGNQANVYAIGAVWRHLNDKSKDMGRFFVNQLIEQTAAKGSSFTAGRVLGLESLAWPRFYEQTFFPGLQKHPKVGSFMGLVDDKEALGKLCLQNKLSGLVKYLNPRDRGQMLEMDLGF